MKDLLVRAFRATLDALAARQRDGVPACLAAARAHAARGGAIRLVAFGKAARTMATAALGALPAARVRGLLVPPEPDAAPLPPLEVVPGGHPLPTAGSFAAARRALALCHAAGPDDHVVFLVSGGGSALLELPYDDGIDVAAWRRFYAALVGCGAPIARINALRRRVSAVKGGRLALTAAGAAGQSTVLVRDVPGAWSDVASGPSLPDDPRDARVVARGAWPDDDTFRRAVAQLGLGPALPTRLAADLAQGRLPPPPQVDAALVAACQATVLLDEDVARAEFAAALRTAGLAVAEVDTDELDATSAGERMLQRLATLRGELPGRRCAVVSSGELSVVLPAQPGRGGRNQQFVLGLAAALAGTSITALSAGTDGVDGNAPAAGAVVDGTTLARAAAAGLDVAHALATCDAFPLLHALGDTIVTGPTGTNVRDLRVLVHAG